MEGGGGGVREERAKAPGVWCSPPTDSPNPLEEAKLHRRTLGLICGFTQRDGPPPPHDGPFCRASELAPLTEANFPGGPSALKP